MKKPPVQFDIGLNVNQQGRPALDCQFALPRLLGTRASLSTELSVSSLTSHSFNMKYFLPSKWNFAIDAVKQVNDFTSASSYAEHVTGVTVSWSRGSHRIGLDAHLRDIHPVIAALSNGKAATASEQVRRCALRTVKTGLSYRYARDRVERDFFAYAVGGYKFSFSSDTYGLFGDVKFSKLEASLQLHRKLASKVVLHSRVGAGAILMLKPGKTPIQDRFFLGGTNEEKTCFRAFGFRGIGPTGKRVGLEQQHDHLGGDVYVSLDNVLSFPLYARDGIDIRGMIFAQSGALVPSLHSKTAQELSSSFKVSVGAGVQIPLGAVGSMEISVGKPVYGVTPTDNLQMLQIGIRLSNSSSFYPLFLRIIQHEKTSKNSSCVCHRTHRCFFYSHFSWVKIHQICPLGKEPRWDEN